MSNKTAEGLRDRLFDTLDALIDKKIGKNEVESICYVNHQIATYLSLPNVKTLDNLKSQLFEVELKNRSQDFDLEIKALEESYRYITTE